jgi:hypothetical protein
MSKEKHIPIIDSEEKFRELITSLLREQGIMGQWEQLEGTTEGKSLPGGIESCSGTILTEDGKIYHYWLDWDPEKIAPDGSKGYYTLGENKYYTDEKGEKCPFFEEASPEEYKRYQEHPEEHIEYLLAKKELNLPLSDKEKEILKEYEEKWK